MGFLRGFDEAGGVGGEEAVGAGRVDEDWEERDGGKGLGEELFEGAGFGAEERAGLCVAFLMVSFFVVGILNVR